MSRAPVSAWWKAQELLARRAHGSQELKNKLKFRNYPVVEIEKAIQRLLKAGLLDDEAFAQRLVAELFFRRGYGYHVIVMRLRQKGLPTDLCERLAKKFFADLDKDDLLTVMLRIIERRRVHEKDRNKLYSWLQRRGFRGDEITCTLQAWSEKDTSN